MIAAALPEAGFLHNNGYAHAVRHVAGTTTNALLALLGFLNTFTCDWWVRRFVDRHVNTRVISNIRLPDWTSAQIETAARLASALIRDGGQTTLAGSGSLPSEIETTPFDARIRLEVLAAHGFGLGPDEIATVLGDFSSGAAACPPQLRAAILGAIR